MMKLHKKVNTIKKAELNHYLSFKFDTKLTYRELCNKIEQLIDGDIALYDERFKKVIVEDFQEKLNESESAQNFSITTQSSSNVSDSINVPEELRAMIRDDNESPTIEFSFPKVKTNFKSTIQSHFDSCHRKINEEWEHNARYYGVAFTNRQKRFPLPPFKVRLINGEIAYIEAVLCLFENKMAVIRLDIPYNSLDTSFVIDNSVILHCINEVFNLYMLPTASDSEALGISGIEFLITAYLQYFCSIKGVDRIYPGSIINNFIVLDWDKLPYDMKELSISAQIDLFKMSVAPFQDLNMYSYEDEATEYINNQAFGKRAFKYVLSTMGKIITISDRKVRSYYKNIGEELSPNEIEERIVLDGRSNVEFVISILLLKCLNNRNNYYQIVSDNASVRKTQKEYNKNEIFIAELQSDCMGSVRQQLSNFAKTMVYLLDEERANQKLAAITRILDDEKTRQYEMLQNAISIGGFLITAVCGLPAIKETLEVLRYTLFGNIGDIPHITINFCSIIAWLCIIVPLILKMTCGRIKKD